MRYLCLGYGDKAKMDALPKEELRGLLHRCVPMVKELDAFRGMVLHEAISWDVTNLRTARGRLVVTDGPFVEAREQIGSFFVFEAPSREEALRVAALHPSARLGEDLGFRIEMRAFGEFTPDSP